MYVEQDSSIVGMKIYLQSFVTLLDLPNPMADLYHVVFPHSDEINAKFLIIAFPPHSITREETEHLS